MTDDKDAFIGRLAREYREAGADIAWRSLQIRRAAKSLAEIDRLLADRPAVDLAEQIQKVETDAIPNVTERIEQICKAINHRDSLKSSLDGMGYSFITGG